MFSAKLNSLRLEFSKRGDFTLRPNENISSVVIRENVSLLYGVYLITAIGHDHKEPIYIGRAGTLRQNGEFGKQGLRVRLTNRQSGVPRNRAFRDYISSNRLDGLHIEWFLTFGCGSQVLPLLVEAQLISAYYAEFKELPKWNKTA